MKAMWFPLFQVALCLCLFATALAVVATKQYSRALQGQKQELASEREGLDTEFNQLRLERGTIASHAQISQQAVQKLDMHVPVQYVIVEASP